MPSDNPDNGNQFESSNQQDYLTVNVYDTITNSIVNIFTPPSGYYDLPNYTKSRLAATAFRTRQSDNWSFKYYRYDERGRVKTMWLMLDGLDVKTVNYEYNSQDMVVALNYNSGIDFKRYRYRYDNAARLQVVDTYDGPESSDDPSYYQTFTDYSYNPNSAVETQNFLTGFTGASLGYDNRGRISSYYSHNSEFIYNLSYLKNSNVLQQELYGSYRDYFANTENLVYKFTYDKSNRLLSATNTAGSSNEYAVENTYDKDGNILTLKRYGDAGIIQDDFAYQYYSGTNKLRKVTGSTDQYQYDLNGNVTTDSLNKNTSAVYDHRNLLIEIYHKRGTPPARIDYFATRYFYDEAGNRIRKLTYKNNDANAGPVLNWNNTSNPGNGWTLFNNEHYVRGVDGKELATYSGNTLTEWYVWASDMVGKIKGSTKYYFFMDHLGSVRAIIDNNYNLVSAVDYDMWGYLLESRVYNSDSAKHKFTGKERDEENLYDYFGARYYDSRIGRWGSPDKIEFKALGWTPYRAFFDNPLLYTDPDGRFEFPQAKDFPRLANYLSEEIQSIALNNKIMNALVKYSGLSTKEIKDALEWGEGPIITVTNLEGAFGQFSMNIGSNELILDVDMVNLLENSDKNTSDVYLFMVAVTILHELTHYGVDKSGLDYWDVSTLRAAEHGEFFERAAYGKEIQSYKAAIDYLNSFNERKKLAKRYYPEYFIDEINISPN